MGNGRFNILDKFSFMQKDKAGSKEQQTASGAMNSNSQQAGSQSMPVPLRQKKSYTAKSSKPQDAAQPAPAAAAAGAAAGAAPAAKAKLSERMQNMPFMLRQKVKRKREEDDSQAAASEVSHRPRLSCLYWQQLSPTHHGGCSKWLWPQLRMACTCSNTHACAVAVAECLAASRAQDLCTQPTQQQDKSSLQHSCPSVSWYWRVLAWSTCAPGDVSTLTMLRYATLTP